jgi:uncharacterized paraquat-inducible protein A
MTINYRKLQQIRPKMIHAVTSSTSELTTHSFQCHQVDNISLLVKLQGEQVTYCTRDHSDMTQGSNAWIYKVMYISNALCNKQ